ncbi:MAG: type II toxin-antitoxin system Phd/YefM family antitoxin [Acidobacteriota bacterium]|jgi:prevent-host-death family protein
MERAKISEVRDRLSYYVRRVRQGETVEILDREHPVARLIPIQTASQESEAWMQHLQRSGIAKVGRMEGVKAILDKRPSDEKSAGVLEALLAERSQER